MAGLDVALLILNAGYCVLGPYVDLRNSEVEALLQVNAVHTCYMLKAMASQLLNRQDKTGMKAGLITVGSHHGMRPVSGFSGYSAGKAYIAHLTNALNVEFGSKVDTLYY